MDGVNKWGMIKSEGMKKNTEIVNSFINFCLSLRTGIYPLLCQPSLHPHPPSYRLLYRRTAALLTSLSRVSLLFLMLVFTTSSRNSIFFWLNGIWKVENSSIFALSSFASGPEEKYWWTVTCVILVFCVVSVRMGRDLCSCVCWKAACRRWWAPCLFPQTRSSPVASLSPPRCCHLSLGKASPPRQHNL